MADEKQPAPDPGPSDPETDAAASPAPAQGPWREGAADDAIAEDAAAEQAEALPPADDEMPRNRWGAWGPVAALIVLILLAAGLYLSWPILQPRLLALLPSAAPQALEAVKALDHRVAQLEAADARLDQAVEAIKASMSALAGQLDELSTGLVNNEALANLGGKLAAMEEAMAQLGRQAGENGAAALAALNAEVDGLKARLGDLADDVADELGQARPPAADMAADMAAGTAADSGAEAATPVPGPSREEVAALAQQTAALADDNNELRQTVAALQARLQQLEGTVQQTARAGHEAGAGQGLVLAIGQLRQTILAGAPYGPDLDAVTALAGDDTALQAAAQSLAPWAGAGVATMRALSDQFPAMTVAVLQADTGESEGFWRRTLHRLTSLVTVRRVGEVEGMETDAILARAERRLAAGELAAAAALIEGLDGPAAEAAQDWLGRAKARLGALAALADLQSRAIAGLAGG